MLVALFSLRYEYLFLKSNKVGWWNWGVSILNFLSLFGLLTVLLIHHRLDQLLVLQLILNLLLLLLITSLVLLVSRRKLFVKMERELNRERDQMIRDMRELIDEKKREKIRKKYSDDAPKKSESNGK